MKKFNSALIFTFFTTVILCSCGQEQSYRRLNGGWYTPDDSLNAFVFINTECPVCIRYQGSFRSLAMPGTHVYFVFPGQQPDDAIKAFASYDSLPLSVLIKDPDYSLVKRLKATVTPQAVVTSGQRIRYSGMIDDRFLSLGSSRPQATVNFLRNALISLLKDEKVSVEHTRTVGCFIEPD